MLTDVFFRRYADTALFESYTDNHRRFLGQAAQLLVDEVLRRNEKAHKDEKADPATIALGFVHSVMCRELGIQYLTPARYNRTWKAPNGNDITQSFEWSVANQTTNYLMFAYDDSRDADSFLKRRMSFIELALQRRAKQLVDRRAALEAAFVRKDASVQLVNSLTSNTFQIKETKNLDDADAAFSAQVLELNERFRQAGIRSPTTTT
jgi:hypothetical protein